jgi:hypothetical protein
MAVKADSVVAEEQSQSELKRLGLAKPELKLTLNIKLSDGTNSSAELNFSSPKDSVVYLAASVNKPIYQITQARYEEFLKTLDDFRDKNFPFAFNRADATSVKIKKANAPEKTIQQEDMNSVIASLAALRAEEFLPATAKNPQFSNSYVFINSAGQEYFQVQFGKTQKTKGGVEAYLTKTNLSEELMLVDKSKVDEILNKAFND